MADDLEKRLAAHGQSVVPDIDPRFADRLESQLRIEHAGAASKQPRRGWTSLPRLAAAALIVVAGVVGLAALAGDDAGVPVAVVDGDPAAPLDAPTEGNVDDGGDVDKYVDMAKDKDNGFRLMGFGHRVYKAYDPRARIVKAHADSVFEVTGKSPLLDIALKLEEIALSDDYFKSRNLYPNVDFYTGLIYQAMGFPMDMFTVLFTIGRMPGWLAHWQELIEQGQRISRPRQIYTGEGERSYTPITKR